MSAECWMFEVNQSLPFWPSRWITIYVSYSGPNWDNYYDSPSTDLNSIKEHLEFTMYGLEPWCDEDAGTEIFYAKLQEFLKDYEADILTLIIKEFEDTNTKPDWYWDT